MWIIEYDESVCLLVEIPTVKMRMLPFGLGQESAVEPMRTQRRHQPSKAGIKALDARRRCAVRLELMALLRTADQLSRCVGSSMMKQQEEAGSKPVTPVSIDKRNASTPSNVRNRSIDRSLACPLHPGA
jgi:hypothetical protein